MNSRLVLVFVLIATAFAGWGSNVKRQATTATTTTTAVNTNNKNGPLSTYTFDYIVIGSGPAGAAVASRLSENATRTVLLVEAGGDALDFYDYGNVKGTGQHTAADIVLTPINWNLTPETPIDWDYVNYGEVNPLGPAFTHQAAGKALGGTTTINTMMYVRGNQADFNYWRDQYNCPGWGWTDVLPYFIKAENSTRYATNPTIHGNKGPINIGPSAFQPAADYDIIVKSNIAVARANGRQLNFTNDWNDGLSTNVVGYHEHTINNQTGQRVTAMEYINPYINASVRGYRPNLFISSRSFVNKINFSKANATATPKATSINFTDNRNKATYTAIANREIIVSAGALRSPQLLKLSGVGPAAELAKFGIPLVANISGVGQNLHDHPVVTVDWLTNAPTPPEASTPAYAQSISARCNTFAKSAQRADSDPRPDIQTIWLPPTFGYMLGFTYNLKPLSRGSLTLATADPTDRPQAIFNYLNDTKGQDLQSMIDSVIGIMKYAMYPAVNLSMWLHRPTDDNGNTSYNRTIVGNWILANYGSGYHYAGSCKMGPSTDPTAVVDPTLKVRGVTGLRVCDASIMPEVTSGNTQAPTYMIGERCADFVKASNP